MARSADATGSGPDPLTPVVFHVLLALSREPLHGYGVMKRVEEDSGMAMGPGTVYGALSRMEQSGWVEEAEAERARGPRRAAGAGLRGDRGGDGGAPGRGGATHPAGPPGRGALPPPRRGGLRWAASAGSWPG